MTTCYPLQHLECWQYTKDAKTVPLWALPYVVAGDHGKLKFMAPNNGGETAIDYGDWLVQMPNEEASIWIDAEFHRTFEISPEAAPR